MDELNEDDNDGDDMALQKDVKSVAVGGGCCVCKNGNAGIKCCVSILSQRKIIYYSLEM